MTASYKTVSNESILIDDQKTEATRLEVRHRLFGSPSKESFLATCWRYMFPLLPPRKI